MLKIAYITKFTLQDFPNKTACIVWFTGCNMRCQYCHNVDFLTQDSHFITEESALEFLQKRKNLLDGVVLSGGECSLGGGEVIDFIEKIKQLGYAVKIDTNGLSYIFIAELINNSKIDYIALDFKAPEYKFDMITGTKNQYKIFEKTLELIINSGIDCEIRTTIHTDLLDETDINKMIGILDNFNYKKTYYIQNFKDYDGKTFKSLPKQQKLLDRKKINNNTSFKIEYRGF